VEELHVADSQNSDDSSVSDDASDQDGLPLYQALRLNLQRLGHAEFVGGARGLEWRVTPPSLALAQQPDRWLALVVGARSLRLLDRLSIAAGPQLETLSHDACPSLLRIRADDVRQLTEMGREAGFIVQNDAPRALLGCLPTIDDPAIRRQAELPLGTDWKVDRFDPLTLSWQQSERAEAVIARRGLFRFCLAYQRYILLCDRGAHFQIPAQVGKFLVARRRPRLLQYSSTNRVLSLPAIFRPPFLVERALILSSGSLPTYQPGSQGGGVLRYTDVPPEVAALAASILRQELIHE
jgi:hypothetical protein